MLLNRSIAVQFTVVFVVALLLVMGSFYLVLESVYRNELKAQAETVADNVDAFGSWVSQYGRVWVKDDNKSYLGQVTLNAPEGAVPADQWHFYSKNPALAQREFSEVVEKSTSPAKFRMTSHNFMNPVNKPDAFESKALDRVRSGRLTEYYEILPEGFRYARTLYEKASCLACHASAETAPNDVKERYGVEHGYGFKEGEVAGIISVRLPIRSFWNVASSVVGPIQIALLVTAFLVAFLFIQFAVVRPLEADARGGEGFHGPGRGPRRLPPRPQERERGPSADPCRRSASREHDNGNPAAGRRPPPAPPAPPA